MHDLQTRTRFIELRAQGLSLKRIASRLKVSMRTLVDWNRQDNEHIRTLRAVELEALQEKILASREQELKSLKSSLDLIQEQILSKSHQYTSLENLYRLAALVRGEIRKVCQTPDFSDPILTDKALDCSEPEPQSELKPPSPVVEKSETAATPTNPAA